MKVYLFKCDYKNVVLQDYPILFGKFFFFLFVVSTVLANVEAFSPIATFTCQLASFASDASVTIHWHVFLFFYILTQEDQTAFNFKFTWVEITPFDCTEKYKGNIIFQIWKHVSPTVCHDNYFWQPILESILNKKKTFTHKWNATIFHKLSDFLLVHFLQKCIKQTSNVDYLIFI